MYDKFCRRTYDSKKSYTARASLSVWCYIHFIVCWYRIRITGTMSQSLYSQSFYVTVGVCLLAFDNTRESNNHKAQEHVQLHVHYYDVFNTLSIQLTNFISTQLTISIWVLSSYEYTIDTYNFEFYSIDFQYCDISVVYASRNWSMHLTILNVRFGQELKYQ